MIRGRFVRLNRGPAVVDFLDQQGREWHAR